MMLAYVTPAELAYVADAQATATLIGWMVGRPLALDYHYALTGGN